MIFIYDFENDVELEMDIDVYHRYSSQIASAFYKLNKKQNNPIDLDYYGLVLTEQEFVIVRNLIMDIVLQ